MEKNLHAFLLPAPVSATDNQDIAVIEIEKTGDTTAALQMISDEEIYMGRNDCRTGRRA